MLFNICLANYHPADRTADSTAINVDYLRKTLSICGHEVIVSMETIHPAAINLFFEDFRFAGADSFINFIKNNKVKTGIIATELMLNSDIPYSKHGMTLGNSPESRASLVKDRVAAFEKIAASADFTWCFLERTANNYKGSLPNCHYFPYGFAGLEYPAIFRRSIKDIDVFFFGAATPHRINTIEGLRKFGINVTTAGKGWQGSYIAPIALHSLLDRTKIGLNLTLECVENSASEDPRFVSCARITQMFDHDLCIVSEEIPSDNPYRNYIINEPLVNLAGKCVELLEQNQTARLGFEKAKAFREEMLASKICAPVVQHTLEHIY
jgi:hypothetical protein